MFERIKKAFSRGARELAEPGGPPSSQIAGDVVSEWAAEQGFKFSARGTSGTVQIDGKVAGKRWRMEVGKPTRSFIMGEEIRGRAELGFSEDIAVLVMNRPLKEALEKKAYSIYTDSLQTMADPNLPEEMRWLSMYDEVGWESLPRPFQERFAVLSDRRETAQAWLSAPLAGLMTQWPQPGPGAEVPFMLMLLRGKAYLRMQYSPADVRVLQHAADIFTAACGAALDGSATDIPL